VKDRQFESVLPGIATAKRSPDRSRLIRATRGALVVQVAAVVVTILLASPDFIDRLLRPTICAGCWDFRGLAFVLLAIFFTPAALALLAVAWALRPDRIWPSWPALAVDLVVLGLVAYSLLLIVAGQGATYDYGPPAFVQMLQALLVLVSDLASLLLVVLHLNAAYGSSDRLLQLTRNVLVAQVLGMVACVALTSPSLSDRLFNGYDFGSEGLPFSRLFNANYGSEGLAFALWTVVLAPGGLVILAAAWRLHRRGTWPVLLPVLVNVVLLAVLGLTGFVGFVGRLDPVQSGLGAAQVLAVVVPAIASLVILAVFRLPQTNPGPGS
jgi:hypothetical protein